MVWRGLGEALDGGSRAPWDARWRGGPLGMGLQVGVISRWGALHARDPEAWEPFEPARRGITWWANLREAILSRVRGRAGSKPPLLGGIAVY